ncbi:RagB/SusD family nutrient uptake outer membrane protein [Chryseobacterium sp. A321]
MSKYFKLFIILCLMINIASCREFLDEKSNSNLSTIQNLDDLQALIDNFGSVTKFASGVETSADDFNMTEAQFNAIQYEEDKRLYLWMPDMVARPSSSGNEWQHCYHAILIVNSVLKSLETDKFSGEMADNIKGQALALRAAHYLDAVQMWSLAYDPATATQSLGVPLRLDADMNTSSKRANLEEVYTQIIKDLKESVGYLPQDQISLARVSKTTALGLLARAYLFMGNYEQALIYSNQALAITSSLLDFSKLDASSTYPIKELNKEVLLRASLDYKGYLKPARIERSIYNKYVTNDLRKDIYFSISSDGDVFFKGYYNSNNGINASVTVDELYLISAESYARLNKTSEAMKVLNDLLITRWKPGTFVSFSASTPEEALTIILEERRKELLLRGLRWSDIKRYNRDGANITLTRVVNGKTYTLPPNDLRYAIAIPEEVIELSGIEQNPR